MSIPPAEERRPRRGRPASGEGLDRGRILSVARELVEAHGVARLTVRALAAELKVSSGALYWHFPTKEHLLSEVAATVLTDVRIPQDVREEDWTAWLSACAHELRRTMHRSPALAAVAGSRIVSTPRGLPFAGRLMRVLQRAGFAGQDRVDAYNAFLGCVLGWVALELAAEPPAQPAWQEAFAQEVDAVAESWGELVEVLPLARNAAFLLRWQSGRSAPLDAAFEATVHVLLDGLRARVGESGRSMALGSVHRS